MEKQVEESLAALERTSIHLVESLDEVSDRLHTTEEIQDILLKQNDELKKLVNRNKAQRRVNKLLALSLAADMILSVLIAWALVRIDTNAANISDLQSNINRNVLCAENKLWMGVLAQAEQKPDRTAEQKKQIEEFKRVFGNAAVTLKCAEVTE